MARLAVSADSTIWSDSSPVETFRDGFPVLAFIKSSRRMWFASFNTSLSSYPIQVLNHTSLALWGLNQGFLNFFSRATACSRE